MLNLLNNISINQKIKIKENLQIGFDQKAKVEKIFEDQGKDIYYKKKKNGIEYFKIGTMFLDYLSDDISELFENFIEEVCKEEEEQKVEEKYIRAYLFYFKSFFEDTKKTKAIEQIRRFKESDVEEVKETIISEIEEIETTDKLEQLIITYNKFIDWTEKLIKNREEHRNQIIKSTENKVVEENLMQVMKFFVEKAYLKQLYKLLIEYCYFKKSVINIIKKKEDIKLRYFYFKEEYNRLIQNQNNPDRFLTLNFNLPPAVANIDEKGNIIYCYAIDKIKEADVFFSINFLQLLELNIRISKCENCNRYFILKKDGTFYCNNPSPQNKNQSCSEYMKAYNHKERLNRDKVKKEIAEEEKRARDRRSVSLRMLLNLKDKEHQEIYKDGMEKWRKEQNKKKLLYKNGKESAEEYVEWLKKSNRTR